MITKAWRYELAAGVVVALGLLSISGGSDPWAQGQPPCTVTVQPGESIQKAIDAASPGAVICLEAGTWEENFTIPKSLKLAGVGREQTIIKGAVEGRPVVLIEIQGLEAEVTIDHLTIAEAKGKSCRLSAPKECPRGIVILSSTKVKVQNTQISGNSFDGIFMVYSPQLSVQSSSISGNGNMGIYMGDSASLELQDSVIKGNRGDGIWMEGLTQVSISNSRISNNGWQGIFMWMWGSGRLKIKGSTLDGNGTNPRCAQAGAICNGIAVGGKFWAVTITDSIIKNNTDWGVTAVLKKCGFAKDYFSGEVTFQGNNVIEGNNKSGNQNGRGNPGDHPWNRLDVPDGQVCLP